MWSSPSSELLPGEIRKVNTELLKHQASGSATVTQLLFVLPSHFSFFLLNDDTSALQAWKHNTHV